MGPAAADFAAAAADIAGDSVAPAVNTERRHRHNNIAEASSSFWWLGRAEVTSPDEDYLCHTKTISSVGITMLHINVWLGKMHNWHLAQRYNAPASLSNVIHDKLRCGCGVVTRHTISLGRASRYLFAAHSANSQSA